MVSGLDGGQWQPGTANHDYDVLRGSDLGAVVRSYGGPSHTETAARHDRIAHRPDHQDQQPDAVAPLGSAVLPWVN
jgi:hypothetical protein